MHCAQVIFQNILQLIIWKKTGLEGFVNFFPVNFNSIDTNSISDIHNKENIYWIINWLSKCIKSYKVRVIEQSKMYDSTYSFKFTS